MEENEENEEERNRRRRRRRKKKRCYICCGSLCGILIIIAIVLITLGLTIFRPKEPKIGVESITLEELRGDIGILSLPPTIHLNVTLGLVVSVRNPNPVGFRYTESTCHMFYRGLEVALIPIPPATIGPRKSIRFVSHLDLLADRLLLDDDTDHLIRDFLAGSLPFSTTTHVSGRVNFLNLLRPRVKATSRCDVTVSVNSLSLNEPDSDRFSASVS